MVITKMLPCTYVRLKKTKYNETKKEKKANKQKSKTRPKPLTDCLNYFLSAFKQNFL